MEKTPWAIGAVILAIFLIIVAYSVGQNSNQNTQPPTTPTEEQQNTAPVTPTTPVASPVVDTSAAPQASPSTKNTTVITNSAPCLTIANEAAQSEEAQGISSNITVTQAHYSSSGCYYELAFNFYSPSQGEVSETVIRAAPNDTVVAYCGYSADNGMSCYDNSGVTTESVFHLIEAELLTN